ncbi:MAG: tRNA guanosine(34) transglycosylase Tgt [Oscillospiraceae bacterium]|nr:tRNA guanosine(34) transglycosylase Tgt [Oscillospiraceae bacterium]
MLKVIKKEGKARLCEFTTVHSQVHTPAFMNVATSGAIKGAVDSVDLESVNCQVMLCNTYHLHVRPNDELIRDLGGLNKFTGWSKTTLTDSGGFQVFSLASLRKIEEEGVSFSSHIDGKHIFMGPCESIRIQSNLGSTIAMAFDECIASSSEFDYVLKSCNRTTRWLYRCKEEMERLNAIHDTINKKQMLFGINQGSIFSDLRIKHMEEIVKLNLDGYAIGGLAVGESKAEMHRIISCVETFMPEDKPRYLMGVGTPGDIIQGVSNGVDLFDCVMPSRNARHGHIFTWNGIININNQKYRCDDNPLEPGCSCPACTAHSRSYIRHLFKSKEMLGMRLCVMHNLYFYNTLMEKIRDNIEQNTFSEFKEKYADLLDTRI